MKNGKTRCANVGFPPEYDPRYETIVSHEVINEKTVVFHTELQDRLNPAVKTRLKYKIVLVEGEFYSIPHVRRRRDRLEFRGRLLDIFILSL